MQGTTYILIVAGVLESVDKVHLVTGKVASKRCGAGVHCYHKSWGAESDGFYSNLNLRNVTLPQSRFLFDNVYFCFNACI